MPGVRFDLCARVWVPEFDLAVLSACEEVARSRVVDGRVHRALVRRQRPREHTRRRNRPFATRRHHEKEEEQEPGESRMVELRTRKSNSNSQGTNDEGAPFPSFSLSRPRWQIQNCAGDQSLPPLPLKLQP